MFEIKIDDAKYWKNCIDSIVSLVDEGSFNISKEGISLKAMDPSGISMVYFMAPNKIFSKYNITEKKDKEAAEKESHDSYIGLNLDNLSKILLSSRSGEQLLMKDKENKMALEFIGSNGHRDYTLPLIDVKKSSDNEPKIEFESFIDIKGDFFKSILKDAAQLSTYVGFKAEDDSFIISAKGDAGEVKEEFKVDKDIIQRLEAKKPSSATFNLDYLTRMVNACPSSENISLSMKTDQPIKLSYKIGDAIVSYYLAPYMES
jgi:proliferating cell nuclear antigen